MNEELPYNVVEAISKTGVGMTLLRKANYVLAFCGTEMHVIKSRSMRYEQVKTTPVKPDLVIGYYQFPEVHSKVIQLPD